MSPTDAATVRRDPLLPGALMRGLLLLAIALLLAEPECAGLAVLLALGAVVGPAGPATRRVLIVEDNTDAAFSLQLLLELSGHAVTVAHTGPEGVARAKEVRPEVVLCDLGLPGLSGHDVARALRADPQTAGARLIALSGHSHPDDLRRSGEAGFDEHLIKPVGPETLRRAVEGPSS
jgi:CheY-like chemotaxis protein